MSTVAQNTADGDLSRPQTLRQMLDGFDPQRWDLEALCDRHGEVPRSVSYGELAAEARAVGNALLRLGVERGDRIALLAENRIEWPIAYLAVAAIGAAVVPLDVFATSAEVAAILKRCPPRLVFTSHQYLDKIAAAKAELGALEHIVTFDHDYRGYRGPAHAKPDRTGSEAHERTARAEANQPVPFDSWDYIDFPALAALGAQLFVYGEDYYSAALVEPLDVAGILFLSTTIGVNMTHRGIMAEVEGLLDLLGRDEVLEKRWLLPLPLHHSWPTVDAMLTPLRAYGSNLLLSTTKLDVLLPAMREHRTDFLHLVPVLIERLFHHLHGEASRQGLLAGLDLPATASPVAELEHALGLDDRRAMLDEMLDGLGLRRLTCIFSAGAHLFASTTTKMRMLGVEACDGYGLTETSPCVTYNRPRDNRPGSAGRAFPTAELRIHEPDERGNGEIRIKGPVVGGGYVDDPAANQALFDEDGWLCTGDIGRFDEDGYLYITGRLKNIIVNEGGKNIYPEEGEAALRRRELIADVVMMPKCVGEREFPYAVIQPDVDALAALEKQQGKRLSEAEIRALIREEIQRAVEDTAYYKLPEDFELCYEPLDAEALRAGIFWFDEAEAEAGHAPSPDGPSSSADASEAGAPLRAAVAEYLCSAIAQVLSTDASSIDLEMSFFGYLSSLDIVQVSTCIDQEAGVKLPPPVLFEHPNVVTLARYLAQSFGAEFAALLGVARGEEPAEDAEVDSAPTPTGDALPLVRRVSDRAQDRPIAIIGMAGIFPGSPDVDAFWQHLEAGDDLITEIPEDRFRWQDYYGDPWSEPNKTSSKWGGFVADFDKFDPRFFGISFKEARMIDPQQRVFLQTVWQTIEDAGYRPSSLRGRPVGLFAGVTCYDYVDVVRQHVSEAGVYTYTGVSPSLLPNRISYLLGIHGPSEVVDTACSSALVALHRARHAIRDGECEMAIAGGVNALLTPELFICFSKSGMLSPEGRCKVFSKDANGYVRGEGAGAVLLKPLDRAEQDGDHVYAVIRGSAVNHGGRASSMTSPNPNAQAELLLAAYEEAGFEPESVSYLEAHGTGTSLGDPIEVNGMKKAFDSLYRRRGRRLAKQHRCGIGSVKTNIGHLESAAGIAGLIKILLAMKHEKLPPSIHCRKLSPYVDLKRSPFYVVRELGPWEQPLADDGQPWPRRAGVSSFGVGGSNAHVAVEQLADEAPATDAPEAPQLLVLSAKNEDRLRAYARKLADFLGPNGLAAQRRAGGPLGLRDVAFTLQVGRDEMEERLAQVVVSLEQMRQTLTAFARGRSDIEGLYRGTVKSSKKLGELDPRPPSSQAAAEQALRQGDAEALAKLWVAGAEVDWQALHRGAQVRRVPLPTYPFLARRCWVGESGG